VGALINP